MNRRVLLIAVLSLALGTTTLMASTTGTMRSIEQIDGVNFLKAADHITFRYDPRDTMFEDALVKAGMMHAERLADELGLGRLELIDAGIKLTFGGGVTTATITIGDTVIIIIIGTSLPPFDIPGNPDGTVDRGAIVESIIFGQDRPIMVPLDVEHFYSIQ